MIEKSLLVKAFIQHYIDALAVYDVVLIRDYYHLPCTLSTPDNVVLLLDDVLFEQEFNKIFNQLKEAKIASFKVLNTSYQLVSEHLLLLNIDWQFIQSDGNLFTEFSAIYHIVIIEKKLKIVSVISQDINQGLSLTEVLHFT